jgi:hypothetical protein
MLMLLACTALAVAATAASAARSTATSHAAVKRGEPTLLGSASAASPETLRTRPAVLSLSGDGTAFLGGRGWRAHGTRVSSFGRLEWTSFGGPTAGGRGLMWLNDCKPDCAGGSFQHYPARVRASAIRKGHYTRLTVSFTANRRSTTGSYELLTAGSNSYWQLSS